MAGAVLLAVLLLGGWYPRPCAAQDRLSVVLAWPDRPQVGLWLRTGDRGEAGLDAGIGSIRRFRDGLDGTVFTVTPAFRWLAGAPTATIGPYFYFGVPVTGVRASGGAAGMSRTFTEWGAGAIIGIGLVYRHTPRLALEGHTGIRADYFEGGEPTGPIAEDTNRAVIGSHSSGIRVRLYF